MKCLLPAALRRAHWALPPRPAQARRLLALALGLPDQGMVILRRWAVALLPLVVPQEQAQEPRRLALVSPPRRRWVVRRRAAPGAPPLLRNPLLLRRRQQWAW